MKIVDAHAHLWLRQDTTIDGQPIRTTTRGRSLFFGSEVQMLPPFMIDGRNSAEVFLANMDYAQVSAAVIVQEFIDGCQNEYLAEVLKKYPERFFVTGLCEWRRPGFLPDAMRLMNSGWKALKIPGHRLQTPKGRASLVGDEMMTMFHEMERRGVLLCIDMDQDPAQSAELREVIQECPDLRIAISHFANVTMRNFEENLLLARNPNVMIESGGITWLFNSEFYPFPSAIKAIQHAIDTVGADKLMWGSDYPRTICAITYRMSYDFITKSSELSEEEKRLFLGENARRFYGFEDLVELPYIKNMSE